MDQQSFPLPRKLFEDLITSENARWEESLFLKLLNKCGITALAEQRRNAMIALAQQGINPFDAQYISTNFRGIYPELVFSVLLENTPSAPVLRAANIVTAILEFRRLVKERELQQEELFRSDADTQRYHHLFGRTVLLHKEKRKWRKELRDNPQSDYIVVSHRGYFYRLPVLVNGTALSPAAIAGQLQAISRLHTQDYNTIPYGLLTSVLTKESMRLFQEIHAGGDAVNVINNALFVVSLDIEQLPSDANDAAAMLHSHLYRNKDYRKSLNLTVLGDGSSGFVFNLFAGVEGVMGAKFAAWVSQYAEKLPVVQESAATSGFTELNFHTAMPAAQMVKLEAELTQKLHACWSRFPAMKRIEKIGKNALKALKISPDAAFHIALHKAYFMHFGRVPYVNNFIDIRSMQYGSISRYLTTTDALKRYIAQPSRAALEEAAQAHTARIEHIRKGHHPLHYIYHYVFLSGSPKIVAVVLLLKAFIPQFMQKYVSPDIWASSIPGVAGIRCLGRFGMQLRFVRKQAVAGHYLIFPEHIELCFLAHEDALLREWDIKAGIESALAEMAQLQEDGAARMARIAEPAA